MTLTKITYEKSRDFLQCSFTLITGHGDWFFELPKNEIVLTTSVGLPHLTGNLHYLLLVNFEKSFEFQSFVCFPNDNDMAIVNSENTVYDDSYDAKSNNALFTYNSLLILKCSEMRSNRLSFVSGTILNAKFVLMVNLHKNALWICLFCSAVSDLTIRA